MTFLDQVSLFLHVLAAVGIMAAGIVQVMSGSRLRRAGSAQDIRRWAGFARSAGPLLIVSAAVSLATGGHLAGSVWTSETRSGFSYPFITIGAASLVLLAPIGPMLGGARLRRLAALAGAGNESDIAGMRTAASSSRMWGPIHSLVGVGVGLIWIMTAKPESWWVTATLIVVTFGLGWASGLLVASESGAG